MGTPCGEPYWATIQIYLLILLTIQNFEVRKNQKCSGALNNLSGRDMFWGLRVPGSPWDGVGF